MLESQFIKSTYVELTSLAPLFTVTDISKCRDADGSIQHYILRYD